MHGKTPNPTSRDVFRSLVRSELKSGADPAILLGFPDFEETIGRFGRMNAKTGHKKDAVTISCCDRLFAKAL